MQRGINCVSCTHKITHTNTSLHIHDREITVWYDHSKTFFLCNEYWPIEAIFLKGVHSKLFSICKLLYNVSLSNNQVTNTIKSEKKYYFWGAHLLEENKRWYSGEMTPLTKNVTRLCSKFADALHPMLTHNKGLRGLWAHLLEFPDLQFLDKCNSPCLNCLQNQKCRKHHYHQSTILLHTLAQTSTLNVILVKSHLY